MYLIVPGNLGSHDSSIEYELQLTHLHNAYTIYVNRIIIISLLVSAVY